MKNIKNITMLILAVIGMVAIIGGSSIQERQIGKYQIERGAMINYNIWSNL